MDALGVRSQEERSEAALYIRNLQSLPKMTLFFQAPNLFAIPCI